MKEPVVYILASKKRGTLYIGVTSDLVKRIYQLKSNSAKGFSKKYHTHRLVYCEQFNAMYEAIKREKQLKKWQRVWKLELVENFNPSWKDLYAKIV